MALRLLLLAAVAVAGGWAECPHKWSHLSPWSDPNTWPDQQVPTGGNVMISTPVLLDVSTPRMDKVLIAAGGQLVFNDAKMLSLTLTANMVELIGGELWIGSEDCPYEAYAEVVLTGKRDESEGAPSVQKAVLVRDGTLEVHGAPKRSWTRLAATLPKTSRDHFTSGAIKSVVDTEDTSGYGFHLYEFDAAGNGVKNWGRANSPSKFIKIAKNVGSIAVVVIYNQALFGTPPPEETATAFETLCFDGQFQSSIRTFAPGQTAAFAAICHIGSPENSIEKVGAFDGDRITTGWLSHTIGDVTFSAISVASTVGYLPVNHIEMISYRADSVPSFEQILTFTDSVGNWRADDTIVIASTDFHHGQAERFMLLECAECEDNQVRIGNPIWFTHWGEVTDGVDMRAEVGLLSRNVRFRGEMEVECYGGNRCDEFDYDTFGGHVKVLKNFDSVRIENAEFVRMGQQAVLGAYPIHFHMCFDTSGKNALIKQNSIHDTFSRCVTIHGTHNVTLEGNVAYNHLGHCYFLEDGGEQHNIIVRNLGLGTRPGTLVPSDKIGEVSTFWITNPDNTILDNVAGGSDGMGFWFPVTILPIGPSKYYDMGLKSGQSLLTVVRAFSGNRAHSNLEFGLRLDDVLNDDGTIGHGRYSPRVDPTDPNSELKQLVMDDFVAYKNTDGAWIKSMWTLCTNFRLAENRLGLLFESSDPDFRNASNQMLRNSRVVGDTANRGEPAGLVKVTENMSVFMSRSIPIRRFTYPQLGVAFYRGPMHIVDTSFAGFMSNDVRKSGAIGKKLSNHYSSSPINSVRNVTFDFDPGEGSRFYDGDENDDGYQERDGNRHNVLVDWDGSLTGSRRSSVIRPIPLLMNARCSPKLDFGPGAVLCSDRFTRLKVGGPRGGPRPRAFMTRDDLMGSEVEVSGGEKQVSFSLNTAESYILHFNETVLPVVVIIPYGLQQGLYQKVAVCIGTNRQFRLKPSSYSPAQSIAEVNADDSNSKYFYDSTVGTLHFRFSNPYPRGEDTTSHCPGKLEDQNGECNPVVTIIQEGEGKDTNTEGDCRQRAYTK